MSSRREVLEAVKEILVLLMDDAEINALIAGDEVDIERLRSIAKEYNELADLLIALDGEELL